jgi:type III secretory pathway component EscT
MDLDGEVRAKQFALHASISRTSFGQNSTQILQPLQLRSMISSLAPLILVCLLCSWIFALLLANFAAQDNMIASLVPQ